MADVTFASFTLEASPAVTDFLVGYRTAVAGGERRTTLSSLNSLFQANITAGLAANRVLVSGPTSNLDASDLSYSTPTLTVPAGFGITGAGSLAFTAGGTNQNITLTPSGTGQFYVNGDASSAAQMTVNTTASGQDAFLYINATAGRNRRLVYQTAGSTRWGVFANNSSESGSNAGSNYTVNAYNDSGAFVDTPLTIFRAAGGSFFVARPLLTGANQTLTAWGVNGVNIRSLSATFTDSSSSGTVATAVANSFAVPTFAASSATTFTNAANLYIAGDVAAGTNVTLTNSYGLWNVGKTRLDGAVTLPSTNTAGLQLYNTADQTTNYERLEALWSSNVGIIRTNTNVASTDRTLSLQSRNSGGSTAQIDLNRGGSGPFAWLQFTGASGATGNRFLVGSTAQLTATSGSIAYLAITPTYNQSSGTAANTDLLINRTQTAVGSGAQLLADFQVGSVSQFSVSNGGAIVSSAQSLSGAGAVNVTQLHTDFTSTGGAQALTLANGTVGQIKTITHVVDGGSGVLTPTTPLGYATITFTNVGDSVTLRYTSAGWACVGVFGAVLA